MTVNLPIAVKQSMHNIIVGNSNSMNCVADASVQLVLTSPPYPMIEMWDSIFQQQDERIILPHTKAEKHNNFEAMHQILDATWTECFRVLQDGGFLCINIGDATRSIDGEFALFPNHSRIFQACVNIGFTALPLILWRKTTNSPNKFMGSGMLPAGAYVTLEHEYILIFRKNAKRVFTKDEEERRRASAYFWFERNQWFSDLWHITGISQYLAHHHRRSAAFPFEIPYRLIQMYSIQGDYVLDPFMGTGMTSIAAVASARNSIGFEIDETLLSSISHNIAQSQDFINHRMQTRIEAHRIFLEDFQLRKNILCKYFNSYINNAVITRQEQVCILPQIAQITRCDTYHFVVDYQPIIPPRNHSFQHMHMLEKLLYKYAREKKVRDDSQWGITTARLRIIADEFRYISDNELYNLLTHHIYEVQWVGIWLVLTRYKKAHTYAQRHQLYQLYIQNTSHYSHALLRMSATHIVGEHCYDAKNSVYMKQIIRKGSDNDVLMILYACLYWMKKRAYYEVYSLLCEYDIRLAQQTNIVCPHKTIIRMIKRLWSLLYKVYDTSNGEDLQLVTFQSQILQQICILL